MPGPLETRKDVVQEAVESGAAHVGRIATIITEAVRDVAREAGSWATDVFELREAQDRARRDHQAETEAEGRGASTVQQALPHPDDADHDDV